MLSAAARNSTAATSLAIAGTNKKSSLFQGVSNTPQSQVGSTHASNKFDLPSITDKLNTKLYEYIKKDKSDGKRFKQVSDALKTCGIEVQKTYILEHRGYWLKNPGTIDDLANILEAFLATVTSTHSNLKATISDFLKETKLGKVKESKEQKSSFVLRLSDEAEEQRIQDQAVKKIQSTKEVAQKLNNVHNTLSTADDNHTSAINDSQALSIEVQSTPTKKARPSITSADSMLPTYRSLPFNSAQLDPVAISKPYTDTENNLSKKRASHQSANSTVTTPTIEMLAIEKTPHYLSSDSRKQANQNSLSSSNVSNTSRASSIDSNQEAQSAPLTFFQPEKEVYLETRADTQNIYSENIQVVGVKNQQRVLIDFSKLKWGNEKIRNLPHLQRLMNIASTSKKTREEVEFYLRKTGLDAIISYQIKSHSLLRTKKYTAKFSPDFIIQTMKLASPSLPYTEDDPSIETARQNVLDKLTEYFGEKEGIGKSHHDKLKKTLADSALHEILMVTPHGSIAWVDQATWPKDTQAFNLLLQAFAKHHGNNGPVDLETKSSLLKGLQDIIATVPKTNIANKVAKTKENDAQEIINKKVARHAEDASDGHLQLKLIAYARGESIEDIDLLVYEFVQRSFKRNKIDEKTQVLLGKAKEQKLDTQTNHSSFEKFCEFFRHPVNTIKGQTDAMHRNQYATNFISLDTAYQKAFEQNIDMVYALYNLIDKKAIDKINDILVAADPESAFGNGAKILTDKIRAACAKQIDEKMATLVGSIDSAFSTKIIQAINHFNTAQTNQSGSALREWFTTFSRQIDAYKAYSAERLAYISNTDKWSNLAADNAALEQSDSFNRDETIASIEIHHKKRIEHMEKALSNALLNAVTAMNFSGRLRDEIRECKNPKLSRIEKAERLATAISNYNAGLEEAINLMQGHPELEKFKAAQQKEFASAQTAAKNLYPNPLSRWGRVKQVLFGEAKKLKWLEHITKGFSTTRKYVLGLSFFTGGAALALGITSAVGVGVLSIFFAPIMVPVITALFIAAGSAVLLGITGHALHNLLHVYSDVRNQEERIKQSINLCNDDIKAASELLDFATIAPQITLETSKPKAVSTNMSPLPAAAIV